MAVKRGDRGYHNQNCINYAIVALVMMPYALVRHAFDCLRGRG